jgi:ABC-2 type transport system ATP-binding protein
MIEFENLTKYYASVAAIRDVSFKVQEGEVLAFLGPNAAGKTTTMRILTGFMPPTSGRVRLAGFDVFAECLQVRKRIGYMPETVGSLS